MKITTVGNKGMHNRILLKLEVMSICLDRDPIWDLITEIQAQVMMETFMIWMKELAWSQKTIKEDSCHKPLKNSAPIRWPILRSIMGSSDKEIEIRIMNLVLIKVMKVWIRLKLRDLTKFLEENKFKKDNPNLEKEFKIQMLTQISSNHMENSWTEDIVPQLEKIDLKITYTIKKLRILLTRLKIACWPINRIEIDKWPNFKEKEKSST